MQSVVCAGVASEVSWEDAKADVALEGQIKGQHHGVPASVVQIPYY